MEIAEKFAYKTNQFVPFGLQRAANSELYCVTSRSKAYILELIYSHHCDERIFMEQSTLDDLSKFIPSHGVPKHAANIFNRSSKIEQNRLMIDYHLMSEELKVSGDRVALSHTRWSPKLPQLPGKYYLAYLTNFGGCEIRQKHTGKLSWCIKTHNVAKDWMIYCQTKMKYSFNSLESYEDAVYCMKITAIAWNNLINENHNAQFCFITANGTIAFYDIDDTLTNHFQKQINLKQTNAIEWFSFVDKHGHHRSYVVACEMKGTICLYGIEYDQIDGSIVDVSETVQLFSAEDGVPVNGIHWEYLEKGNQLVFVTGKGMNVFVCVFNIDDLGTSTCFHYIGHLTITGITKRDSLEYIVGTLSGHLECLHINIDVNSISIESEELKPPNGHSKYALYGIASSTNNAFLLGAYFAGRPYDHLSLREPGHIAVCHQQKSSNALDALLNNSTFSLSNMQDLAEAVRSSQLRNDKPFQEYLSIYPSEIVISDEFVYMLKIRLIVTSARSTYLRQKNRMLESGNLHGEYNVLKKFIFAIQSYRLLLRLNKNYEQLSDFQKLSFHCHRASLQEFVNLSIFEEYEALKTQFCSLIEMLLKTLNSSVEQFIENCAYCDTPIDSTKDVCDQEHELPRCCISFIHISMMGQYQCVHCQLFALEDTSKLNEIMPTQNSDDPICPLCDMPMNRPHLTYTNYFD